MINKIWNWIKNIFKPENKILILKCMRETAKQKKIRLKHQGDNK